MNSYETFAEQGYEIFSACDPVPLAALRESLFEKIRELVPYRGESAASFFDNFHEYGLGGAELNKVRLAAVNFCTEKKAAKQIFDSLSRPLLDLCGPDIASQRVCNVVIHQPGDKDQAPIHRDAPSNSHFEVIAWTPLVDTYGTKSMFLLNKRHSAEALARLKAGEGFEDFRRYTEKHSTFVEVPFGAVCLFQAGLSHGVPVNEESETRWSLNVRYKNLFSPYGDKGLGNFFEVLQLSPLSKVAFDFSRQEFGPFDA